MVALKPQFQMASPSRAPTKQERRGGIETMWSRGIAPRSGGKQERRGGIETKAREIFLEAISKEAGTPWWH